jgi:hypothetical protein
MGLESQSTPDPRQSYIGPVTYPGDAPFGRQQVLDQGIPVYRRHWTTVVAAEAWPRWFSDIELDGRGRVVINRSDVFTVASAAAVTRSPMSCEQALVAVCAWGAGTRWRGVVRAQGAWRARSFAKVGVSLSHAANVLIDGGGPVDAYSLLLTGEHHIQGLGPAFFTKFLYFVGYETVPQPHRPLILDQYVAIGLNDIRCTTWPMTGWSADQYAEYLQWANDEATGPGPIGNEDEAEYRIWQHGKSLK